MFRLQTTFAQQRRLGRTLHSSYSTMSKPTHKHTNALINCTSPYLLQHAHNPVDWLPWGQEAIDRAKREDKPIFLSVGYSTCHWCHVMEKESFESESIAQIMNDHFINIKVDREERPDVDRVYMTFVQATTGSGGWPMNVFLTPDLKPFFGGTYFPPTDRLESGTGFPTLLRRINDLWHTKRDHLEQSGSQIIDALRGQKSDQVTRNDQWLQKDQVEDILAEGVDTFLSIFDARLGGFGRAPKFPRPVILNFLFRELYRSTQNEKLKGRHDHILHACILTLTKMSQGGVYDHLGGGFHRYSVDSEWHVPHFEKMTYDQGQLLVSYAEAYQITKDQRFAQVVRDTIEYMCRDMLLRDSSGEAFYSAEDADSLPKHESHEKIEGAFYVWTHEELQQHLKDPKLVEIFEFTYDCRNKGNVKPSSDPRGELTNQNVLIQRHSLDEVAQHFDKEVDDLVESINKAKKILFEARKQRPRPHLDDKIITSWNGLMISGLCKASQVLGEPKYAEQAERVVSFIRAKLYDTEKKVLHRSYRSGTNAPPIEGFLNDYSFLISGLLDLYETTGRLEHLIWAQELQGKQDELFLDADGGGYFEVTGQDPSILLRMKEDYDGAEPSGNSVSAMNLLRLSHFCDMDMANKYLNQADHLFHHTKDMLTEAQEAVPQLLCALDERMNPGKHIAIVYDDKCQDLSEITSTIHKQHLPSKSIIFVNRSDQEVVSYIEQNLPYLSHASVKGNKATVYICQKFSCQAPVNTSQDLEKLLFK